MLGGANFSSPSPVRIAMNSVLLLLTLLSIYRIGKHPGDFSFEDYSEEEDSDEDTQNPLLPQIQCLHVRSTIRHRFALTVVSSRIINPGYIPQEAKFNVLIPASAFLSNFETEIDGKGREVYSHVRAKDTKEEAFELTGITTQARDAIWFSASVTLEAGRSILFNLTYEELLVRRGGQYRHVVTMNPGQIVPDLKVEVLLHETRKLGKFWIYRSSPRTSSDSDRRNLNAQVHKLNEYKANIMYMPTPQQQRAMSKTGVTGQFVVSYDVVREPQRHSEILVKDGYFAHFFAIEQPNSLSKHVIFVLDVSGSMLGRKMEDMKAAMFNILEELHPQDYLSLISYSTDVRIWLLDSKSSWASHKWSYESVVKESRWSSMVVPANDVNIEEAKAIIKILYAEGACNIHSALKQAIKLSNLGTTKLKSRTNQQTSPETIIFFLADGGPTEGEMDTLKIVQQITAYNNNKGKAAIFSVAFGRHADFNFLRKLSLDNSGFARKIYESTDIPLQLMDFYREISSPLLTNITFDYQNGQVLQDSLTTRKFRYLFSGTELVVVGKLKDATGLSCRVKGRSSEGVKLFQATNVVTVTHDLKRMWAFLTLQQLLNKFDENSRSMAIKIALEYNLVTPVTSFALKKKTAGDIMVDMHPAEPEQTFTDPMMDKDFKIADHVHRRKNNRKMKEDNDDGNDSLDDDDDDDDDDDYDDDDDDEDEYDDESEEDGKSTSRSINGVPIIQISAIIITLLQYV